MIFQINYQTDKYNSYYDINKPYTDKLDYKLFGTEDIDNFLKEFGYKEVVETLEYNHLMFLCALLRLLIIYEFGGTYLDSDIVLNPSIKNMEAELDAKFGDRCIIPFTRSLFFIRAPKHSIFIKYLIDKYLMKIVLTYDVKMLSFLNLPKFSKDIALVDEETLKQYFKHDKVTTL